MEQRPGLSILSVSGAGASAAFANEPGGHRFQRIPPTERRGRVHTSTITVAVLPVPQAHELTIEPDDLEWRTCRSGGPGGQHCNKKDTAVQLTHLPSGLQVRCEAERSQRQNRQAALELLRARLLEGKRVRQTEARNLRRRDQLGTGQRGDKRRTVRLQDDTVVDHVTGKRIKARDYLRGLLDGLVS